MDRIFHLNTVKISIVIATHRRDKGLLRTIESLSCCSVPECSMQILVVENGYKGNAEKICREVNIGIPVNYCYIKEPGQSNARRYSLGLIGEDEFVIFFDDDVSFCRETLDAYYLAFKKFGAGYFYGGPIYPKYEIEPSIGYIELFPYSVKGFVPFEEVTITDKPDFLGANWAAFALDILSAGNFNSDLGPGGKNRSTGHETEMQERLLQKGLSGVYLPDARVWHFVPKSVLNINWLKNRYYKMGLKHGMSLSRTLHKPYLCSVPRWLIRDFVVKFFYMVVYTLRPRRDFHYFSKKLSFYKSLGVVAYFKRNNEQF
jgi:glycosyltransferase involved in cell wall biosynthesis